MRRLIGMVVRLKISQAPIIVSACTSDSKKFMDAFGCHITFILGLDATCKEPYLPMMLVKGMGLNYGHCPITMPF